MILNLDKFPFEGCLILFPFPLHTHMLLRSQEPTLTPLWFVRD